MIPSTLILFSAALAAVATPLTRQDDGPNCESFGANGFAVSGNFKLAAVNTTLPNANTTGVPLALANAGAVVGESFFALAVSRLLRFMQYGTDIYPATDSVFDSDNQRRAALPSEWRDASTLGVCV